LRYYIYQHYFSTWYKYYVRVQHNNVVVLASFQVITKVCNAIVLASFWVTPTSFGLPSALVYSRVPWNAAEYHQVHNCHLRYCIYQHYFSAGYKYYVCVQHNNAVILARFWVTTKVCNADVFTSFRVPPTNFGIILLIIFPYFCCRFADSCKPSMFILFESNLCGIHGTNPHQYPSSIL
jgi:hypothetical protein